MEYIKNKALLILKKYWNSKRRVSLICLIFAMLPIVLSIPGGIFGLLLGCSMNEGGTDHCVRLGIPFGDLLYPFTVLPWLSMITFPIGFGGMIVWEIWLKISAFFGTKE